MRRKVHPTKNMQMSAERIRGHIMLNTRKSVANQDADIKQHMLNKCVPAQANTILITPNQSNLGIAVAAWIILKYFVHETVNVTKRRRLKTKSESGFSIILIKPSLPLK